MIRSNSKQMAQVEGEHMPLTNALLALWLIVLGDDDYMAK